MLFAYNLFLWFYVEYFYWIYVVNWKIVFIHNQSSSSLYNVELNNMNSVCFVTHLPRQWKMDQHHVCSKVISPHLPLNTLRLCAEHCNYPERKKWIIKKNVKTKLKLNFCIYSSSSRSSLLCDPNNNINLWAIIFN